MASIPFQQPVSQRTLFQIGSVGKHVTAFAVLRLVDAGRVLLDRPIGEYVDGLPASWRGASVRQLLQQVSGIPDYSDVFTDWDRPQTKAVVIERMAGVAPHFAPGEAWSYSNTNYLLLGWLIEAVSGGSYGRFVADQLFRPASLPHARADAAQEPIMLRAEPYEADEAGKVRHAVRMENAVSAAADGGILFAAEDWGPWSSAIEGRRLVSDGSWKAMHSAGRLNSGRETDYGFGWRVGRTRGQIFYSHSGGVPGFQTHVLRLPARHLTIVLTLNLGRGGGWGTLPTQIAEALHPGTTYYGITEPEPISAIRAERARALLIEGRRDEAFVAPELASALRAAGRPPRPRAMTPEDRFFPIESYRVAGGTIQRFRLELNGNPRFPIIGWTPDDRAYLLG